MGDHFAAGRDGCFTLVALFSGACEYCSSVSHPTQHARVSLQLARAKRKGWSRADLRNEVRRWSLVRESALGSCNLPRPGHDGVSCSVVWRPCVADAFVVQGPSNVQQPSAIQGCGRDGPVNSFRSLGLRGGVCRSVFAPAQYSPRLPARCVLALPFCDGPPCTLRRTFERWQVQHHQLHHAQCAGKVSQQARCHPGSVLRCARLLR